MKKIFTSLFALLFAMSLAAQPVYIWGGPGDPNSEFNGGFNDWTTVGVSASHPDSAVNAVWVWDADGTDAGDPYEGAFSGLNTIIDSRSDSNGVALFPSDYYDNRGISVGNFGQGPAGSPHRGELISPIIDCSAHSKVAIQFTQSFRRFSSTATSLEVSIDGGNSWEPFEINPPSFYDFQVGYNETTLLGIGSNQATRPNSVQVVDITDVAAGESNVQFKFVLTGGYYYWFVDDVYVIETPDHNLMLTTYFYTPGSYATPASQIETDTFIFNAGIKNIGSEDAQNVQLRADVLDADRNIIHSDSVFVGLIEEDSIVMAEIPRTWAPEVPQGSYQIRWSARNLDGEDYNEQDNVFVAPFLATASTYSKDYLTNPAQTNRIAGDIKWKIANLYSTGNEMVGGHFEVRTFQTSLNHDQGLEGRMATFFLAKYDATDFESGNLDVFNHPNLELVGISSPPAFTADQAGQLLTFEMLDFEEWDKGNDVVGVRLEPNTDYWLIADFPEHMQIGLHVNAVPYYQISTIVANAMGWARGGFGPQASALLRMDISFETSTDKNPLPSNTMSMFPNPASDYFTVDLDFGTATDATIAVADITGKVVEMKHVKGAAKEQVKFTTNGLGTGTYLVRVITDEGSLTKKIVIQK